MDLSSKESPFLAGRVMNTEEQMTKLMDHIYEYRESESVEAFGQILECQRDKAVLEILRMKAVESNPVELAAIQGKIKAIGDIIALFNFEFKKREVKPKKKKKITKRKPRRGPTDAGPAI